MVAYYGRHCYYATRRLRMSTDRIEKKIVLNAPLKRVWRALSDSAEFGHWFGMKFNGPFQTGAVMNGVIVPTGVNREVAVAQKPHEGKAFEIVIEQMVPERLFSFRWHPYAFEPNVDYSNEPMTPFITAPVWNGPLNFIPNQW